MAELGLDSRRNGEERQAEVLDWQIRTVFEPGCAGAFVFSWTDEWHRGGHEIEDWDFGLTDRDARPKPALAALSRAFDEAPFPAIVAGPAYRSWSAPTTERARCARRLDGLARVDYPDFEVIVVDDGSTDATARDRRELRRAADRDRRTRACAARNTGWQAAHGEIVAYHRRRRAARTRTGSATSRTRS